VRPVTPTVDESHADDDDAAMVLLQRLIRGRAQQNLMFEGKQHRLPLIRELRFVEERPETKLNVPPFGSQPGVLADAAVDMVAGYVLSQQTDLLSKEVKKLNEERQLAHVATRAEAARRQREAAEGGRRQADAVVRAEREAQFQTVMGAVQASTDAFLDQLLREAHDEAAERQARAPPPPLPPALPPALPSSTLPRATEHGADGGTEGTNAVTATPRHATASRVVHDLVSGFLLPEVEKEMTRRTAELDARRFVAAAHEAVREAVEQVV
jgi:hypothetical protein